jgi:hypothetical protein
VGASGACLKAFVFGWVSHLRRSKSPFLFSQPSRAGLTSAAPPALPERVRIQLIGPSAPLLNVWNKPGIAGSEAHISTAASSFFCFLDGFLIDRP